MARIKWRGARRKRVRVGEWLTVPMLVIEPRPSGDSEVFCQARPAAARRGFREDQLCASRANAVVVFHGRRLPVCQMHRRTYERWGAEGEHHAEELWGWTW